MALSRREVMMEQWSKYIHKTGMELLQLKPGTSQEDIDAQQQQARRNLRLAKLLQKRIRVSDMADGGMNIAIDVEWDTSMWSREELESGCDALISIIMDISVARCGSNASQDRTLLSSSTLPATRNAGQERKSQALRMLSKLLHRHKEVEEHIKKQVDTLINRAINRRLVNGKSSSYLNLLHVLECCAPKFHRDFSTHNFTGKLFDLMLLEMKLAAIIIQHTWRSKKELRIKREAGDKPVKRYAEGFDEVSDSRTKISLRELTIHARTDSLVRLWRLMHAELSADDKEILSGIRGPVHMAGEYITAGLNTTLFLCSSKTIRGAADHREGLIQSNGITCLSFLIGTVSGPFALLACKILAEVAKSPTCIPQLLDSGCINSVLLFLRYCRNILKNSSPEFSTSTRALEAGSVNGSPAVPVAKTMDLSAALEGIKAALFTLTRSGVHAAGLFRARGMYNFTVPNKRDVHSVSYKVLLSNFDKLKDTDIILRLGNRSVVTELTSMLTEYTDLLLVRRTMMCLLALSCSEVGEIVLEEVTAFGGRALFRLVSFLDDETGENGIDDEDACAAANEDLGGSGCAHYCKSVATLSMCIILQLCTLGHGRTALINSGILRMMNHLVCSPSLFNNPSYFRGIFVLAALSRRGGGTDPAQGEGEWRAYDPEGVEAAMHKKNAIIKYIYIDLLRSIRGPPNSFCADEENLELVIEKLAVLHPHEVAAKELCANAERVGCKELIDFIVRPPDPIYYTKLSWDLLAGGAVIIEAMTRSVNAVSIILSPETVKHIGQCLRMAYNEMASTQPKSPHVAYLLLNMALSSTEAAFRLCVSSKGNFDMARVIFKGYRAANGIIAAKYFLAFLKDVHLHLSQQMRSLQDKLALTSVEFLDELCGLVQIGAGSGSTPAEILKELEHLAMELGNLVCDIIGNLQNAFGDSAARIRQVLHVLCKLLAKLTSVSVGVDEGIRSWKIIATLRLHLPPTLAAADPRVTVGTIEFETGIGMLSEYYYDVLANLCIINVGRTSVLEDGFLRRALETIRILLPALESENDHKEQAYLRKCGLAIPPPKKERLVMAACFRLCARIANFSLPNVGSSNDILLHDSYALVPMCGKILHSKECYRQDVLFESCLDLVSQLALDATRTTLLFKINEIAPCIEHELSRVSELSVTGARHCVNYVLNIAMGMRRANMRIKQLLPNVREGLTRTARFHPELSQLVADAMYVSCKDIDTGNNGSRATSSDSKYSSEDLTEEDRALIETLPSDSVLNELVYLAAKEERLKSMTHQLNSRTNVAYPSGNNVDRIAQVGSLDVCGVTSCGSLKDPPHPYHGADTQMPYSLVPLSMASPILKTHSNKPGMLDLTKIASSATGLVSRPDIMDISRESARGKELQDLLYQRKVHNGFIFRHNEEGDLPILTIRPISAEDFGKAAKPANRYMFTDPDYVKATTPKKFIKSSSSNSDYSSSIMHSDGNHLHSPIELRFSNNSMSRESGFSSPIVAHRDIQSKSANKTPPICKPEGARRGKSSGKHSKHIQTALPRNTIDIIDVDQLPELALTRPPDLVRSKHLR
jgi:hypothetical protein